MDAPVRDPRPVPPPGPLGLLGGSFDPVHVGHLALARAARDALRLAEVRLIPAAQPWQKGEITDAEQRAAMVALAIAGEPGLRLDRGELDRGGPSYTIDTLRALRAEVGAARPLVLIVGADQLQRLDTWRDWQQLPQYAHLAVAQRAGTPPLPPGLQPWVDARRAPDAAALAAAPAGRIVTLPMTPADASATEIRALLQAPSGAAGDARLAQLLPPAVLLYIRRARLYGARPS